MLLVADGLYSNGPFIKQLKEKGIRFAIVGRKADHKALFEAVDRAEETDPKSVTRFSRKGSGGLRHGFRFINGVPLNGTRSDLQAGFMEYREKSRKGKTRTWTWVTDMRITKRNAMKLMQAARARWKTGNETFNTLNSQGYAYGHNFGHGNRNLSSVLTALTFIAFTIDQAQQPLRELYRQAMRSAERPLYFWEKLRALFLTHLVGEWEDPCRSIIHGYERPRLKPADTS